MVIELNLTPTAPEPVPTPKEALMAHADEVPDHLKDPDHTVPLSVWEKIRADAAENAKEAAADGR